MPVHLMGSNPLHLDLMQGTLTTAGWDRSDVHLQPTRTALEQALTQTPQATLVLDLGSAEDSSALPWLEQLTRRWRGLQVVLLCSQRHEALLLQAMRSGVREVLDSPAEPQELLQALQRLGQAIGTRTQEAAGPTGQGAGQVLAFVSSKGGSGNTVLASNLGWLLATEFEQRSALVDLDLLYGDASFYLGGGQAQHSVASLMRQGPRLDGQLLRSSLHAVHPRLQLLAAPALPDMAPPPTDALSQVIGLLRQQESVVVVDVPHHLDEAGLQALRLADRVLLLIRNRVPDIRNAQRLIRLLREQGIARERLLPVLNRHSRDGGLDRAAIDKALDPGIAHLVADDPTALHGCVHLGLPLHEHAPGSPVLRDLRQIASSVLQLPLPRRRSWLSRWMGP